MPFGRLAKFSVIAALVTAAAGCGSTPAASRPAKVVYVTATNGSSYGTELAQGFTTGVASVPGVESDVTGPDRFDPVKQAEMFRDVANGPVGGMVVSMMAPDQFVEPLAAAVAKHIPVAAIDTAPPVGSGVELYIGNDNYALGQLLAGLVIDQLPANAAGTVVLGNPRPGLATLDMRAAGMRDAFTARLPKSRVLGPFDTSDRAAISLTAWQQLVDANPAALAFLGVGATDGPNLVTIRRARKATWLCGGFDLDPAGLRAVKNGELVLVSPEHFLKGAVAGRIEARAVKNGTPLPKGWIVTPALAVTRQNADEIIQRQVSLQTKQAWLKPKLDEFLGKNGPPVHPLLDAR
jgi:ribose transport system substrate-binding protein